MPPFARHRMLGRVACCLAFEQTEASGPGARQHEPLLRRAAFPTRPAPSRSAAPAQSPAPRGRCGPPANRRADRDPDHSNLANTSAVDSGTRGFTSNTGAPETSDKSMGLSRSPAASPRIGKLSKQAGTSLPSVGATDSACFGSICQREVSNRSAAAASAEPPPRPEATGRFFSSVSDAPCSTAAAEASARAAFSARLSSSSLSSDLNGPVTESERSSAGTALSRSPSVQNANTVSIACRPSGSLPRTWRARLSLAGATSCAARLKARRWLASTH